MVILRQRNRSRRERPPTKNLCISKKCLHGRVARPFAGLCEGRDNRSPNRAFLFFAEQVPYRSGVGTAGKLLCPALSTARTAKITLSLDLSIVMLLTFPAACACSHSGLVVARHNTS